MPDDLSQFMREVDPVMDQDRFLYSMARFLIEGDEREEARMLLACSCETREESRRYFCDEVGPYENHVLVLRFYGPRKVYELLNERGFPGSNLFHALQRAGEALRPGRCDEVAIEGAVALTDVPPADWRNELMAVLDGTSVDNQAIGYKATRSWQGLRFRSESEVRIAQALDRANAMFLPNCRARVGSRAETRCRLEADFIVMAEARWGVLEVDGAEWHPSSRAAQDHQRDRPFKYHGASVVERFDAGECFENPDGVVNQFLALLRKARSA
jgi:hypothetical protein